MCYTAPVFGFTCDDKREIMRFLRQLPSDQHRVVVALPYRVGLWVSRSDVTGGQEADLQETRALENILDGFTQEVFGSELVQHIMSQTVERRAKWAEWGDHLEQVPQECVQALKILENHAEEKEVNAFRQRLLEIAEAVALAFREQQNQKAADRIRLYATYHLGAMKARMRRQNYISFERFLNISPAERQALHKLSSSLGLSYL